MKIALGCLAAYTALSFLSILWAAVPGDAWEGANRTLLYLLVFALFALLAASGARARRCCWATWTLAMIGAGGVRRAARERRRRRAACRACSRKGAWSIRAATPTPTRRSG